MASDAFKERVELTKVKIDQFAHERILEKLRDGESVQELFVICLLMPGATVLDVMNRDQVLVTLEAYGTGEFRRALTALLNAERPDSMILGLFMENDEWLIQAGFHIFTNSLGGSA